MSTLSCERVRSGNLWIDIKVKKSTVELVFELIPITVTTSSTNSVTIDSLYVNGNVSINGNELFDDQNYITNGTSSVNSDTNTVGFRLFIQNGYLKCVKKEVSYESYAVSSNTVNLSNYNPILKKLVKETFCRPSVIWGFIQVSEVQKKVQDQIVFLAERKGIKVPEKFNVGGPQRSGLAHTYWSPAVDWLSYPLIREIDSPTVSKNMIDVDRNFISPNLEQMNFKQLVEHYYGCSTNKMLEEIWKVIAVGSEGEKVEFSTALEEHLREEYWLRTGSSTIVKSDDNHVIRLGDRHIQTRIFVLGPPILKVMGFDYFYQAIPNFSIKWMNRFGYFSDLGEITSNLEFNLITLLKHVSSKKLLSILFADKLGPNLDDLQDTAKMLRDYEDPQKIPPTLRLQYPTGLIVDFKFKTLKELHDKISIQYTIIKAEASRKEIPVHCRYQNLHGREKDGLRLVVPNSTSDLSVWGKLLNICIASYGDKAANADTLLLGVEKEGQIVYCIEFRSIITVRPTEETYGFSVASENPFESIREQETVREALPKLLQKNVAIIPEETAKLEEEQYYCTPSILQFRGQKNADPSLEDRNAVDTMLTDWAMENLEFLKEINGIFDSFDNYGGHYADALRYNMRPEYNVVINNFIVD